MTTEELTEIKSAAAKIHAAAVAAGRWEPRPEWESKLMDIVCDISRAVEAEKIQRHASMGAFAENWSGEDGDFGYNYCSCIKDCVEDCLADAVIDILDTVEGFMHWNYERLLSFANEAKPYGNSFAQTCLQLTWFCVQACTGHFNILFRIIEVLKQYTEAHGIDLRRHVQLKMKYNETVKA